MARGIFDFSKTKKTFLISTNFFERGVNIVYDNAMGGEKFKGLKFVLTGTLENFSRLDAQKLIENEGGECSSSVSKNTDYVLAGENAGSKLDKATALGVKVISEQQFLEMLKNKKCHIFIHKLKFV